MPSASHYPGAQKIEIAANHLAVFETAIRQLKNGIVAKGFSQEAADSLTFTLSAYTLTIPPEESHSGAFHIFADGQPFYELAVSAPGSLGEFSPPANGDYTKAPPKQQAGMLAMELAFNLMSNMDKMLKKFYPFKDRQDTIAGGVSGSVMNYDYNTTFRCEPYTYMTTLSEFLQYRLGMLAPQKPGTVAKPGNTGGMKP